jgi:hypothetical protein
MLKETTQWQQQPRHGVEYMDLELFKHLSHKVCFGGFIPLQMCQDIGFIAIHAGIQNVSRLLEQYYCFVVFHSQILQT